MTLFNLHPEEYVWRNLSLRGLIPGDYIAMTIKGGSK